MKTLRIALIIVLGSMLAPGCGQQRETLFQTSTIPALMAGVYDGRMTCAELKTHGDTGLGTFNALDGEMVMLEGTVYQVRGDGTAHPAPDDARTPFAAVTFFEADRTDRADAPMKLDDLTKHIDGMLPSRNLPFAVRVRGRFRYVRTRSVPRQRRPYPPLLEVVKNQPVFEFRKVSGTLVGFRMPEYVEGVNVPGYHLHFLTADRTAGGHVLDLVTDKVTIEIDSCRSIFIELPRTRDFDDSDLTGGTRGELEKVEK